jgi:hypothetical protein
MQDKSTELKPAVNEFATNAPQLNNGSASQKDIASSALPILDRVLLELPRVTQLEWTQDLWMHRSSEEDDLMEDLQQAERVFVLQGVAADLTAITLGRPRLREIFKSKLPPDTSKVPDFAQRFFADANEYLMPSQAGDIEPAVAKMRVKYTKKQLIDAIDTVKDNLISEEQQVLDLMVVMLSSGNR